MYEETDKKMSINWLSLIIKLIILAIFVFALCWLFKSFGSSSGALATNDFNPNITSMKEAGFEYFTGNNLPSKIGNTKKLTLKEMLDQKLLVDFTNNGKTCDINSSYIQATKTNDNNYALKVSLDCDKKSDYIVTTIDSDAIAIKNATETCKDCSDQIKNLENKIDSLSSTISNAANNSNKNNSNQSSSSSNKTNSSSNSKKTTTTTTTTTTTIKYTVICGICSNCSGCNNCGTCTPSKTIWYKHIKYSNWIEGNLTGENIENKTENCEKEKEIIYTSNYITSDCYTTCNSTGCTYYIPINKAGIKVTSVSKFNDADFETYVNKYASNDYWYAGKINSFYLRNNIIPSNLKTYKDATLKDYQVYYANPIKASDDKYYIPIKIVNNSNANITAYNNKYYYGLKIAFEYQKDSTCSSKSYYRYVETKWTTNIKEEGYTYTGISEYR